jgi:hypothetical protein
VIAHSYINNAIGLVTATVSRYPLDKCLIQNLIQNRTYYRKCPGKHESYYLLYKGKSQNHRSQERAANAEKQVGGYLNKTYLAFTYVYVKILFCA